MFLLFVSRQLPHCPPSWTPIAHTLKGERVMYVPVEPAPQEKQGRAAFGPDVQQQQRASDLHLVGLQESLASLLCVGVLQLIQLQCSLKLALAFVLLPGSDQDHSEVVMIFGGAWSFLHALL